jgi:hypothetical protein
LVDKLHKHYRLLRQGQQIYPWDLVSIKTIGFASFIQVCILLQRFGCVSDKIGKFQRSKERGRKDYIVTAKVHAIDIEPLTPSLSQFKYLMRYPLTSSKMMLCNLDQIARKPDYNQSDESDDLYRNDDPNENDDFYVVEIKETLDTRYGSYLSTSKI